MISNNKPLFDHIPVTSPSHSVTMRYYHILIKYDSSDENAQYEWKNDNNLKLHLL